MFYLIFAGQQQSFLGRRHLFWRRIVGFCQNVQSVYFVYFVRLFFYSSENEILISEYCQKISYLIIMKRVLTKL